MRKYIEAARMFTTTGIVRNARIAIEDGCFAEVGTRENLELPSGVSAEDFGDAALAPGFIDVHIHGGGGHDVMEGSAEALRAVEAQLGKTGVTSYLATTVTASVEKTIDSLSRIGEWIEQHRFSSGSATPIGIHLEGPFISHAKRGVHPPAFIQPPSTELFDRLFDASLGTVRLMTVAPEGVGAEAMILHASEKDVAVSVGHSDATFEQTRKAIDAGARHATHTFNAMRPLDHREPGILGAVLADENLSAEIIADGIHVHPEMVKMFVRAKGVDRAVLVTDGISATGMGDGEYQLGGFKVTVSGNRCELEGRLAGSVLTLDAAVRNALQFADLTLHEAVRMATYNPARLLGLQDRGEIKAGAIADLNVLTNQGFVQRTFFAGI